MDGFKFATPVQMPLRLVKRTFQSGAGKMQPIQRLKGKGPTKTITRAELKVLMKRRSDTEDPEAAELGLSV